jgi:TetR/AcrR family transcriptional regulator, mexJK operon transcriptional repressor
MMRERLIKIKRMRRTFSRKRLEDERLEELFDIAADEFLSGGFEAASMNKIARRANASKATFYARFPTKEDLFVAVIEHRMERIFKAVTSALSSNAPLAQALHEFGSNLIRLALTQEQVGLVRLISMESERFPRLAQRFLELGPALGLKTLAAYMRQNIDSGGLRKADPERMAEHFISLVTGGEVRWFVLGLRPKPGPKRLQDHLQAALQTFLLAYGSDL